MDGFKNIEIINFRGIDHLKIGDFARVNVFLGQNNSGKSTVLEAITMLMGMSNPDIPQIINAIRARRPFSNFIDIKYFFRNMDVAVSPEVSSLQTDGTSRHLKLGLSYVWDEFANAKNEPAQQTGSVIYANTLEMHFDVTKGLDNQSYNSWIRVNPQGLVVNRKSAEGYMEQNRAGLIPSDLMTNNLVNDLTELFRRNMKDSVLKLLKLFDERVNGIEILTDDVYIGFEGMTEMLPIRVTGDGLRRYLSIVASAANPMINVILIDEIDNGLHYSVYEKLWKAIFMLAVESDKQLFVTTHSKETLHYLNEMLIFNPQYQHEISLYTLVKTLNNGHQAYKYSYEGLSGACENDIELRGLV